MAPSSCTVPPPLLGEEPLEQAVTPRAAAPAEAAIRTERRGTRARRSRIVHPTYSILVCEYRRGRSALPGRLRSDPGGDWIANRTGTVT